MLETIWAFLTDLPNRAVLSWIGGGIVVVAGGIWAVLKFFAKKPARPTIQSDQGSVAIGGNNRNSPINIDNSRAGKR